MKVLPLCYHAGKECSLEDEASDKIYVSESFFEELHNPEMDAGVLLVLELRNESGRVTCSPCGVHYDANDVLYVPQWMWSELQGSDETVSCTFTRIHPSTALMIALEPHTSDLIHCEDPITALRDAFEQYTCIERGKTYPLFIDGKLLTVTIPVVKPDCDEPLCIRTVELVVDMLPARDAPLPTPPVAMGGAGGASSAAPTAETATATVSTPVAAFGRKFQYPPNFSPFSGKGNTLGGK
jgi:hypothetical protein